LIVTTTAAYLSVTNNLARYQKMTAADPNVKTASTYYAANIGKVTSVADFVGNHRLLSYALDAYGLGDQINAKALVKKVLEGGVSNSKSLANTLADPRWKAFAKAFDFAGKGAASVSTPTAVSTTQSAYVENQLEKNRGKEDVGVQLAMYFNRMAPSITNAFGILGDKNLLQVVQTIFSLPPSSSATNIDAQASIIDRLLPIADLQDPKKLKQLTARFTAMYELTYGPSSGATRSLTVVSGNNTPTVSAASAILSSVISSNDSTSSGISFSATLLTSLQGLRLGGG
jgi:hypothetical protein